jgi:hypothetical protein
MVTALKVGALIVLAQTYRALTFVHGALSRL